MGCAPCYERVHCISNLYQCVALSLSVNTKRLIESSISMTNYLELNSRNFEDEKYGWVRTPGLMWT